MSLRQSLLIGMIALTAGVPVMACTGGQQWVAESGLYRTDVTDDTPFIDPGQVVHFDFQLWNKSDPAYGLDELVDYSSARVTMMEGNDNVFMNELPYSKDRELAGFDYEFPKKDADYVLTIDYIKQEKSIAQASVPLRVGKGTRAIIWSIAVMIVSAIVLVALGLQYLSKHYLSNQYLSKKRR